MLLGLLLAYISFWLGLHRELYHYVSTRVFHKGEVANVSAFIRELKGVSIEDMFFYNSTPLVIMGFMGLILLFFSKDYRKDVLFFTPLIALGLSSFWAGNRMYMYLAPFLGIGAGYLISVVYEAVKEKVSVRDAIGKVVILLIGVYISVPQALGFVTAKPVIPDEVFYALKRLSKYEGSGWTWLDYGYAIRYLSGIDPLLDNGNWNMVVARPVALSFTSSLREEVFVISLMDRIMNRIPYRGFYCSINQRASYYPYLDKVFIFVFQSDLTNRAVYTMGGKDVGIFSVSDCKMEDGAYRCPEASYDPQTGVIYSENVGSEIRIVDREKGEIWVLPGEGKVKLALIMSDDDLHEVVYDENAEKTFMFKLFIDRDRSMNFEIVEDVFPYMVVYRVR